MEAWEGWRAIFETPPPPEEDEDDPELDLVPSRVGAPALAFFFSDVEPNDTPESCISPTGMTPFGSGGTRSSSPESPLNAFLEAGYGCELEEEEKSDPLKRALVLGAEATRRRNRTALDPPE